MEKRSRTSSPISNSYPTDNSSVESAWRKALAFKDLGSSARVQSQKRLADAQLVRAQAESEAITATKNYCVDTRAQADDSLQRAESTLSKAERIRSDAQEWAASLEEEIQFRLEDANRKRETARVYAEKIEATARGAADALLDQTRAGAEEMAIRMRSESAADIRKILSEIEVARAAAEDELEAQRLLTETARIRAFSVGLNAEAAESAQAQEKPVKFTTVAKQNRRPKAKKRASKSTSARKAA
jgi:hypothetical protein